MFCSVAVGIAVAVAAALAPLGPEFPAPTATILERSAGIIGRLVASAVLVAAIAAGACNWRDVFSTGHLLDLYRHFSIVERIRNLNPTANEEILTTRKSATDHAFLLTRQPPSQSRRFRGPPLGSAFAAPNTRHVGML